MIESVAARRGPPVLPSGWIPGILLGVYAGFAAVMVGWWTLLFLLALPLLVAIGWWTLIGHSRWFLAFCATTLLLPPLPFSWGNTGPHPAIVFAALGLVAGWLRLSQWRVPLTGLTASLVVFFFLLLASVSFAMLYSGWAVGAGSFARVGLFGISIYTFFYLAYGPASSGSANPLRWVGWLYGLGAVAALFACLDFYFQFPPLTSHGQQFVWMPDRVLRRAQGFFYEAGMLGNLCAFFLLMTVLAWLRPRFQRRFISRKLLLFGGLTFSAALIFSFSRSSLLNLVVGLTVLLFLHRDRLPYFRLVTVGLFVAAGGLLLAFVLFPVYVEFYFSRLWDTVSQLFTEPNLWLSGRFETWRTLLIFLANHPWHLLAGIGFKTLPYTDFIGVPVVADNMYLSILIETGFIGLVGMIVVHAAILQAAFQAFRSANAEASFFGVWIFCFWVGQLFQMLSVDVLTYWRVLPIYFAVLALAVQQANRVPTARLVAT